MLTKSQEDLMCMGQKYPALEAEVERVNSRNRDYRVREESHKEAICDTQDERDKVQAELAQQKDLYDSLSKLAAKYRAALEQARKMLYLAAHYDDFQLLHGSRCRDVLAIIDVALAETKTERSET